MQHLTPHPRVAAPLPAAIAARGTSAVPRGAVDALRDASPGRGLPLPPRFLRHADEQTVVAVHAVAAALEALDASPDRRARWGVVAAPRLAGRPAAARILPAWHAGGHAAVSPHIVPQCSLHALASAVSVSLGCHGPHLGVGGGPGAVAEALLVVPWLVGSGTAPGVVLVASGWDAEPELDHAGRGGADVVVRAVAVVFEAVAAGATSRTLGLSLDCRPPARPSHGADELDRFAHLAAAALDPAARLPATWSFAARRGGCLRVDLGDRALQEAA